MWFINSKKKVLIIDDDKSLLRQISFHFQHHQDCETFVAEDGESGLEMAKKNEIDLIVLDWNLPDIQGIEVLAKLKEHVSTKEIPVLMLTGHNKIGNIEDAFSLGAEAYVLKPFSLKKLGEKSQQLMN
jgi:two-component system phosphate regulon response regulator PhoB